MAERVERRLAHFLTFIRRSVMPIFGCSSIGAPVAKSDAIGIEMPQDFPIEAHNTVVQKLGPYQQCNPEIWSELVGGWNAIAIRFKAMSNADDRFTASIRSKGAFSEPDERVLQEEALFAFFVNGYAALESLAYAAFAMGAMLRPADFPMIAAATRRAVTPSTTRQRFSTSFPGTSIEAGLSTLIADPEFKRWGSVRNVLAHRSAPARHHHMSLDSKSPQKTDWEIAGGLAINDQTTTSERPWLAGTLTDCVVAVADFATANFL